MVFGRKLSRGRKSREALFKSLIKALVIYGKITTTYAKAKAITAEVDKIVNIAKENSITAKRRVLAKLNNDREIVEKLFLAASKFAGRKGGYTRITNLPPRRGDMAKMASIEWVEKIEEPKKKKEKVEKKTVKGKSK